jgi:Fe-S-cluster containining protein
MLTDLVQIRRLGEHKREENGRLRVHLKTHNYVERKLKKLAQEIEDQTDCRVCANCCKVAEVELKERDIERLARFMRITPKKFMAEYTGLDESGERILRRSEAGCVFLSGNDCTIYEERPEACQRFPNLIRGDGPMSTRMWQFIDRATYCPIVYNSLEAFKDETGFRRVKPA